MQKNKKYEVYILTHSYVNDETNQNTIKSIYKIIGLQDEIITQEIGRFDIYKNKQIIKINAISFIINLSTIYEYTIEKIKKYLNQNETVVRHIIIKTKKQTHQSIDYKNPITTKKYLFESARMMPRELTKFTGKSQKTLSKHTKRQKHLGLIIRKINN